MTVPATVRKEISRRDFDEVWNKHNLDAISEIYTPDFRGHGFPAGKTLDREQYLWLAGLFIRACPDCSIEPLDIRADDEFVYADWHFVGTHTEAIGHFPPTNTEIQLNGTGRHRHEEEQVAEIWIDANWLSIVRQLIRGYSLQVRDFFLSH